jgi:hypothetical protein
MPSTERFGTRQAFAVNAGLRLYSRQKQMLAKKQQLITGKHSDDYCTDK